MTGVAGRSLARLAQAALAVAVAWPFYMGLARQSEDEALRAALDRALRAGGAERLAEAALDRGEPDDAALLAELARRLGRALSAALEARIAAAQADAAHPADGLARCLRGALTGSMDDGVAAACTLAADFTVLGDLRDLAIHGAAWATGRGYDGAVLALSVAGLGATALGAAGAAPGKAGLALAKGAQRAGQVPPALARAAAAELRLVAAGGDAARLARAARAVDQVRGAHGAVEAMRMLRHARSLDDLADAAGMYARYGRIARPVMALTGRTSIHAVKAGYKLMPALLPAAAMLAASLALLLAGLALRGAIERRRPRQAAW